MSGPTEAQVPQCVESEVAAGTHELDSGLQMTDSPPGTHSVHTVVMQGPRWPASVSDTPWMRVQDSNTRSPGQGGGLALLSCTEYQEVQ